ncbi:two-component sensor histidine kinase [Streptomyces sp. TRM66268-LWL]|uniref:histidine kinase n=1 Tax=Streptomyces polyasparticus TaxID=2767826 RepID=A0ABR7SBA4_9ACTN|nr:histidine kinase [Streptomyces polyasparticus]MBC9712756.1 two-component sensor histidine kinase [Streptomyces polyasparticus]
METEERRGWRQHLRDALRPDPKPAPLPRRAVRWDVVLAVLLTVVSLIVAARYPDSGPVRMQQDVSAPPSVTDTPTPPQAPTPPEAPTQPEFPPYPEVQPPTHPEFPPYPEVRPPTHIRVDEEPPAGFWLLVVLSALPLAGRRRYPLTAFAVVLFAMLVLSDDATWMNVVTCVIGAYSAVMYSRHRVGAAVSMMTAALLAGLAFRNAEPIMPGWLTPAVVLLLAGVVTILVRVWQRQLAAGRDRYARLQQTQEEAMRRAVAEERSRIAAELHDVVTHNVSVMVIQAGAARKVMDVAPERSKQALLAVESGGRAAMAELRHVMGLLAVPDNERPDGFAPQPGLDRLDALVDRVRAAGTPVSIAVSLPPDPLPPGVDLTAYRVVQEALTNTLKHAPGADAAVTIGHTDELLEIDVTDTGGTREAAVVDGNGRGHIGLRERLAVYGGELETGPTLAGGYRVKARIPWRAA